MRKAKKMRLERKAKRQEARQEARFRRIAKRDRATQARIANRAKNPMKEEVETETNTDILNRAYEEAPENPTLNLSQQQKATNFLLKRKRKPEDNPEYLAAQTMEERERQIKQANSERNEALKKLNQTPKSEMWGDDEGVFVNEDLTEEPDTETEAETHEAIMQDEEDNFCFDGKEEDYLDPDTLGVIFKAGEAAADKYRQKRFSEGKKAFGQTKKSYEAEQARKNRVAKGSKEDETAIEAAARAAEAEAKRTTFKSYTNYFWLAGLALVATGFYLYFAGKKTVK